MIKNILYDFDNTLVDLSDIHYEVLNQALMEVSGFSISREDHINKYNGLTTKDKLKMLVSEGSIFKKDIKSIYWLKQDKTQSIMAKNLSMDWDKIKLHQRIFEYGIRVGCVSNAIHKTTHTGLEITGQKEFMETILSNEDVKVNKPNPEPYFHAFRSMRINPEETLIVEDSPIGIDSATKSGAHVLIVKDPSEVTINNISKTIMHINTRQDKVQRILDLNYLEVINA